jgi:hypothetical protein
MDAGQIYASNDGSPTSVEYADARDYFTYNADTVVYNILTNKIGSVEAAIPASISTPYTYTVTESDQASGLLQGQIWMQTHSSQHGDLIRAFANLSPTTITVSTSPPLLPISVSVTTDNGATDLNAGHVVTISLRADPRTC